MVVSVRKRAKAYIQYLCTQIEPNEHLAPREEERKTTRGLTTKQKASSYNIVFIRSHIFQIDMYLVPWVLQT